MTLKIQLYTDAVPKRYQALVLRVPTLGIVRTSMWYYAYQHAVSLRPACGISATSMWTFFYQVVAPLLLRCPDNIADEQQVGEERANL